MKTEFTAEQVELTRVVENLAQKLGPASVDALSDERRRAALRDGIDAVGILDLRNDEGGPDVASGVELGIVSQIFGRHLVDVPFLGPVVAAETRRLAGIGGDAAESSTVALDPAGRGLAVWEPDGTASPSMAIDVDAGATALGLIPSGEGYQLAVAEVIDIHRPVDLTRAVGSIPAGAPVRPIVGAYLSPSDVERVSVVGQVAVVSDLIGAMGGAHELATDYAKIRKQYGRTIGSFQAVQHALAESVALVEGATSIGRYAAWALDALENDQSRRGAHIAKIYTAGVGRRVCETAIQIHGGIGNTWDCLAHIYLRRVLHSTELFGTGEVHLEKLAQELLLDNTSLTGQVGV